MCDWAKKVSYLCVWATCNLILHFSGTLIGSARGTGLLPDCGRNLYKLLVFFFRFLYSYSLSAALRLWTLLDSDLENSCCFVRKKSFWKHISTPSCVFPHLQNGHDGVVRVWCCERKERVLTLSLEHVIEAWYFEEEKRKFRPLLDKNWNYWTFLIFLNNFKIRKWK